MKITVTDRDFVDRRKRLAKFAPVLLTVSLLIVAGFGLWAYFYQPLLANPFEVARQIQANELDATMVALMAVMLPIVTLVCMGMLGALICVAWAFTSNERRYQQIIDSLSGQA